MTIKIRIKKYRRILLIYNIVVYLLCVPLLIFTVWQALVSRDRQYLFQRLGFSYPQLPENSIWIHAASVGEVSAILPLLKLLRRQYADVAIVITTFTPTGGKFMRCQLSDNMYHCYLPIDYFGAVHRFIKVLRHPRCAIVMETEIWPNLFLQCKQNDIPIIIINGRLSSRTMSARQWMKKVYAVVLQMPSIILARSNNDRDNFIQLGASLERVKTIGNIKFSYNKNVSDRTSENILARPYVLAASTHEGEEKALLMSWLSIDAAADVLLVIAPRHPKRRDEILQQLSVLTDKIAVRSKNDVINDDTCIYLVDTLGELTDFMPPAKFIFMGGSLVNIGGHNIFEPASLGKAIVFGRFMHNFSDAATLFLQRDAALMMDTDADVSSTFQQLLNDPARCEELGLNAKELVSQYEDVAARYVAELDVYIGIKPNPPRSSFE